MSEIERILSDLRKGYNSYKDIEYITVIKSGKEAEVHLVESGSKFYALKHYKPGLKYSSRKEYFTMGEILDSREARAIKNNSRFGKEILVTSWAYREYEAMRKLYRSGANIPEVYRVGSDYLLQEFIGSPDGSPAPQLYKVDLTIEEATRSFFQVSSDIQLFWEEGYVHGDLSAYNILWDRGNTVTIDFPQVIMTSHNHESPQKLLRDIENIRKYYRKYNIDGYEDEIARLRELAYGYWGVG